MGRPTVATPLSSANTSRSSRYVVPTATVWASPPVIVSVGTDATFASKDAVTSSPLAGTPSGSNVAVTTPENEPAALGVNVAVAAPVPSVDDVADAGAN